MSGTIGFVVFFLAAVGAIYYFLGRWAAAECYQRGYPEWLGWVILFAAGPFLCWLIITFMPKKPDDLLPPQLYMATHAALAEESAGNHRTAGSSTGWTSPAAGGVAPPGWVNPYGAPPAAGGGATPQAAPGWGATPQAAPGWGATPQPAARWEPPKPLSQPDSGTTCEECRRPIQAGLWVCGHCGAPRPTH